jgi:hypothetical protein
MTEKYLDNYIKHLKLVYSEWEVENAVWLNKTEKIIDELSDELEEIDDFRPYKEVT